MTRRSTKKSLRRAEAAARSGMYLEAAAIYDAMLVNFEDEFPSLLDHAAVIWGKVEALNGAGEHIAAQEFADSAFYLLSVHTLMEVAAA